MEKRAWIPSMTCLWAALLVACVSGIAPGTGWAFVDTTKTITTICGSTGSSASMILDTDGDGFTDYEECNGLAAGTQLNGDIHYITFGGACVTGVSCSAASDPLKLDPTKRDLFVILKRNPPNLIPNVPLSTLLNTYVTGLGVVVHELTVEPANAPDREIVTRANSTLQKAVRITESAEITTDYGTGAWGTPNGNDRAIVYTQHISERITTECANYPGNLCIDSTGGVGKDQVIANYIKYVLSHETAHMNKLAKSSDLALGGHHYASSNSGTVMEQGITSGVSKGKLTYYLPTAFSATRQINDKSDAQLIGF